MNARDQDKYILAVDHGSTGLKTSLFSVSGKSIDFEFEPTPITILPEGGAEQDPEEWWQATIKTCQRLVEKKSVPVEDIVAIGVSSTFSSTVAVDKKGEPLMNALTWADTRGAPYVKKVVGGAIELGGYSLSSLLSWIPKTAGIPALSGKDDIAHLLFVKYAHPEIYKETYMFLGSKDYLNLKLSGEFASSPDSMMLFWVINTKDINHLDYDDKLIKQLNIDRDKLPPLMSAIDILGNVRPEIADEIGISRDVKVVVGSPDLQSAGVGAGTVEHYHLICDFHGPATNAIVAGAESVFQECIAAFVTSYAGRPAILCGAGALELGITASFEDLVIADDLFAVLERTIDGIIVNEDTLAADVIAGVGIGGHYLGHEHTLKHLRDNCLNASLLKPKTREQWVEQGSPSLVKRAGDKAREILKHHHPEKLEEGTAEELNNIIHAAHQELS